MGIPSTPSSPSSSANEDPFAPERMKGSLCFCGKETIEDHDFCFCSPQCAREDALRALDDPECHYRDVIRRACIKAGVADLYPRRRMSAKELRPLPAEERVSATMPLRVIRPANAGHRRNKPTYDTRQEGGNLPLTSGKMPQKVFPTLSQITGAVLAKKGMTGEQFISGQRDRPRWHGFGTVPAPTTDCPEDPPPVISLDVVPLPDAHHGARQTLRRVPRSTTGLKNNIRKSVAALLKVTQRKSTMKGSDTSPAETRVFGHAIANPAYAPPAIPIRSSRALRRSVSFAGWDAFPQDAELDADNDSLLRILAEMREEMKHDEDVDLMSFFDEGDEEF